MRNKTWKTLAVATLVGPTLGFMGCSTGGDSDADKSGGNEVTAPVLSEPVAILEKKAGDSKALALGVVLIKTQAEYDALGDKNIYPGVDFDANDLVIAALGEQKTGGFAIDITAIQIEGDKLYVQGTTTAPGKDAVTTQALTYPYAAALIANTTATQAVSDID